MIDDWLLAFADVSGAADILSGFIGLNERLRIKDFDHARAMALLAACGGDTLQAAGALTWNLAYPRRV